MNVKEKVAFVTGSASGFGRGIAERLAREGATVVVADLSANGSTVSDAIVSTGGKAIFKQLDITHNDQVQKVVAEILAELGRIDILVNNAGYPQRNMPLLDVTEEAFDMIYKVNVKGIFFMSKAIVPHMIAQGGGVVINTASTGAIRPRPGLAWYNGAKGAVVVTTKSMAIELAEKNVRVNALCPTSGDTPMLTEFIGGTTNEETKLKFLKPIPMGRFCTPEDMGAAALYLASEDASFITGVCLEVDGGRCI